MIEVTTNVHKMTDKFLQYTSRFISIVLIAIILMRSYALGLFYILEKFIGENSQIAKQIVDDPWHHYQFGLLLMILGFFIYKTRKSFVLLAIGLGIFLEEWAVFLSDLGLSTNQFYATKMDFISIILIVSAIYISMKFLIWRRSLRSSN